MLIKSGILVNLFHFMRFGPSTLAVQCYAPLQSVREDQAGPDHHHRLMSDFFLWEAMVVI